MIETATRSQEGSSQPNQKSQRSLRDVIVQKFGTVPNPGNPFLATILLCSRKVEDEVITAALKNILEESFTKADAVNPFVKDSESSQVSGLIIDYGKQVLQLVQGPDHNIYSYLSNLKLAKDLVTDSIVLFFDDDTAKLAIKDCVQIDKAPPRALEVEDNIQDKSEEEISDSVLADFFNLIELGSKCNEQSEIHKVNFSDIARVNFPKLFPSINSLEMYRRSNLFFTLDEFVDNLCAFPQLTRDCEINHPLENPLKY